eukprot:Opistho-2@50281
MGSRRAASRSPLARAFYTYGERCAAHPYEIIAIIVLLVSVCAVPFLHSTVDFQRPKPLRLFATTSTNESAPESSASASSHASASVLRVERVVISSDREGQFEGPGMLTAGNMNRVREFERDVLNARVSVEGNWYSLVDVCHKPAGSQACYTASPLDWTHNEDRLYASDAEVLVSLQSASSVGVSGEKVLRSSVLRGARFDAGEGQLTGATSIVLTYFFRTDDAVSLHAYRLWESILSNAAKKGTWSVHRNTVAFGSETMRVYYWDADALSSDVLALITCNCITILYTYFMFSKLWRLGSKYVLGITGVLTVAGSFVATFAVFKLFRMHIQLALSEAMPFLFFVIGFENVHLVAKRAISRKTMTVSEAVASSLAESAPSLTADAAIKTLVLGMGSMSGVARMDHICLFGAFSVVANYALFMAAFPAALAITLKVLRSRTDASTAARDESATDQTTAPRNPTHTNTTASSASGTLSGSSSPSSKKGVDPELQNISQALREYDGASADADANPTVERFKLIAIFGLLALHAANAFAAAAISPASLSHVLCVD